MVTPSLRAPRHPEESIECDQKAGRVTCGRMMRFKASPDQAMCAAGAENKVMHSCLTIGDTAVMASDGSNTGKPDFKMRNWWGGSLSPAMVLEEYRWKIRNGLNPVLQFITLPSDSSIRGVLPPAADLNKKELANFRGQAEKGNPSPGLPNLYSEPSVTFAADFP